MSRPELELIQANQALEPVGREEDRMILNWGATRRSGILAMALVLATSCLAGRHAATPPSGPRRIALLIGINDYSASKLTRSGETPEEGNRTSWPNLRGAVNDVTDMREALTAAFGFDEGDILTLTDQSATRAAILDAIERHLVKQARPGVWIVFDYSGHGSQRVNSKSTEPDHRDETLVPADSRLGVGDIRDKELRRLFNRILDRGARLTVILDACHSASGARGLLPDAIVRGIEIDKRDVADGADAGPRLEDRDALILAASQDFQSAWETWDEEEEEHQGAFTLALLQSLRLAGGIESAERTFLRARARLGKGRTVQHPVLAGNSNARRSPLFGGRTDRRADKPVVAVKEVSADGGIQLQGGWANGLSLGSRLRPIGSDQAKDPILLEVVQMLGLSRSLAKRVDTADSDPSPIEAGSLFEVVGWASPPGPPLRVFMAKAGKREPVGLKLAKDLRAKAARGKFAWVEDPTADPPTHTLRWRDGGWQLAGPRTRDLGAGATAETVAKEIAPGPAKLFVQLPIPSGLVGRIRIGPGTDRSAVQPTSDPSAANYLLVGRLRENGIEYAWIRPGATSPDGQISGLPSRTAWYAAASAGDAEAGGDEAGKLEEAALRLAKIYSWQSLQSDPRNEFPYRLAIRRPDENESLVEDGLLRENHEYGLVLTVRETDRPFHVAPRYVYVFVIDSFGNSVLLFPTTGTENRFPIQADKPPSRIALDTNPIFRASAPFGVDTYFLLTTDEPLPNPWVLDYEGVRTRGPKGGSPLEELLSQTGGTRAADRIWTRVAWSIQRRMFVSLAKVN